MADVLSGILQDIATTGTAKPKATIEGMLLAYTSIILMSCLSILFGAFRSTSRLQKQKDSGQKAQAMTIKDAATLPLISSCALLCLYILFKDRIVENIYFKSTFILIFEKAANLLFNFNCSEEITEMLNDYLKLFSEDCINLLTLYFSGFGVLSLTYLLSPFVNEFVPENYQARHHLVYTKGSEEVINFTFRTADIIALGICSVIGGVYLWNKHWIANNIFAIAFALNDMEFMHLNNVLIGCTLLGGLFIYDIFWVFATDVMVTVATSFEAPIKLVFPDDLLKNGLNGNNFVMLGLGDVIIPGIFIAFLLRFDESLKRSQKLYFYSSFIAYFFGLVVTIVIKSIFEHAQPALLYLVPACIGIPCAVALIKGDLNALLKYHDNPEEFESGDLTANSVAADCT